MQFFVFGLLFFENTTHFNLLHTFFYKKLWKFWIKWTLVQGYIGLRVSGPIFSYENLSDVRSILWGTTEIAHLYLNSNFRLEVKDMTKHFWNMRIFYYNRTKTTNMLHLVICRTYAIKTVIPVTDITISNYIETMELMWDSFLD